jgi:hypothetical protein
MDLTANCDGVLALRSSLEESKASLELRRYKDLNKQSRKKAKKDQGQTSDALFGQLATHFPSISRVFADFLAKIRSRCTFWPTFYRISFDFVIDFDDFWPKFAESIIRLKSQLKTHKQQVDTLEEARARCEQVTTHAFIRDFYRSFRGFRRFCRLYHFCPTFWGDVFRFFTLFSVDFAVSCRYFYLIFSALFRRSLLWRCLRRRVR